MRGCSDLSVTLSPRKPCERLCSMHYVINDISLVFGFEFSVYEDEMYIANCGYLPEKSDN